MEKDENAFSTSANRKVYTAPNITTNQNTASLLHILYWLLLLNSVYFLYIFSIVIEHMYCLSQIFSYRSFRTVNSNEKQHLPNKVWTLNMYTTGNC